MDRRLKYATFVLLIIMIILLGLDSTNSRSDFFSLKLQCCQYVLSLLILFIIIFDVIIFVKNYRDNKENILDDFNFKIHGLSFVVHMFALSFFVGNAGSFFLGGSNAFLDLKYLNNPVKGTFYVEDVTKIDLSKYQHKYEFLYYEYKVHALDDKNNKVIFNDPNNIFPMYSKYKSEYLISYYPNTRIVLKAKPASPSKPD